MNATREQMTAFLATVLGLLVAAITLHAGGGLGNVVGGAFLTYVLTIIGVAVKMQLHLVKVVTATGRGSIITGVVIVLLLSSFARSIAAVLS
ncbi:hypothetical protein OOK58_59115 [Streptomyces sp. NBC_01728]|uniref:hypothetical protein n=1 Tax=unclassified Streptomyces TaxID=2593676 RepID=UPI002253B69B|nr:MULTISPECIES: hypothetical protein [unclassified Streptomyces]MCX4462421.1 hypothetical protein [Streptomyces sp. NBC_01719]MCX4500851.1 hypothetical protein [Streptomyces sp. NBC_01728]